MKIKTLISCLLVSSTLLGCNSGQSNAISSVQSPSIATNQNLNKKQSLKSDTIPDAQQYEIVYGASTGIYSVPIYGLLVRGSLENVFISEVAAFVMEGIGSIMFANLGGLVTAFTDGIYHAIANMVTRHDGYQHINYLGVGPQLEGVKCPLILSTGGFNVDGAGNFGNSTEIHEFNSNLWNDISDAKVYDEIVQTSVSWDRTIKYANANGLSLAGITPYMVIVTKYGEVKYYDPSKNQWSDLMDQAHKGDINYVNSNNELSNTVTAMSVLWPSNGDDPKIVLGTDNNDANGAEVYYYNGHSWTNFGIRTGHGDWGYKNTVTQLDVSWDRYGYETPDSSAPYIVAATNFGEVKYYDPSRKDWFNLVRDDDKGNIENVVNGRAIKNDGIGVMSVDWSPSGDPQVMLGTNNSGDNGAEVYYYNGQVWNNFGIKTHQGDWGVDNAVTAMQVAWCGQNCIPRILVGTNYAEVKYYDPSRNSWFNLVRDDNKGNIEHVANGKAIEGNTILDLQAYWPSSGDPQVVIATNNSNKNAAEVYYYDSHTWTNFGVTSDNGDWGTDNAVTSMRVYWPLNEDLTPKGNGVPYILAGTNYGEIKVFDPGVNHWNQLVLFH